MMTISEVKAHLIRNQFTHIRTAAGLVTIAQWQPYGVAGMSCLFRSIDFDRRRIFERETAVGVAGVWEFTRETPPCTGPCIAELMPGEACGRIAEELTEEDLES